MKPMSAADLHGTWATVLTPFTHDDRLDLDELERELDALLPVAPDGVYGHGTAGEFYNQTDEEWESVAAAVARRCTAAGLPFQLGASHPSPVQALHRIRRAAQLAPAAIQVILPDWLRLSAAERHTCLEMYSASAAPIGLVLYNPPHARNVLDPVELARVCADFESIVGVKTADGGPDWYAAMRPVTERVSVFVPGHHLATGLRNGARGAYSNVACLSPAGACRWGRGSLEDPQWGLAIERDIDRFMQTGVQPLIARGYTSTTLDKALAAAGGFLGEVGHVRRPYATATTAEIDRLRSAAAELPDFLRPANAGRD